MPELEYRASKHWASFCTPSRVIAYLNPSQNHVRRFLTLSSEDEPDTTPTPSTGSSLERFPFVFWIEAEADLPRAVELIRKSAAAISHITGIRRTANRKEYLSAEEISSELEVFEGVKNQVLVNKYERNRGGRKKCIAHYGKSCMVCGFDFESTYGRIAVGYIHVHHIVPISTVGKRYRLDPIKDLRPVCANCHAVIHRREPALSLEEVCDLFQQTAKNFSRFKNSF